MPKYFPQEKYFLQEKEGRWHVMSKKEVEGRVVLTGVYKFAEGVKRGEALPRLIRRWEIEQAKIENKESDQKTVKESKRLVEKLDKIIKDLCVFPSEAEIDKMLNDLPPRMASFNDYMRNIRSAHHEHITSFAVVQTMWQQHHRDFMFARVQLDQTAQCDQQVGQHQLGQVSDKTTSLVPPVDAAPVVITDGIGESSK